MGVDLQRIGPRRERSGPATFLWNHRWDADKAPEEALAALGELARRRLDFRVVLAGESFVEQASAHREAIEALGDRVVQFGFLDDDAYVAALHSADAVVSTAHQEFFGISVVEAMYAGALPDPARPPRLPRAGAARSGGPVPLPHPGPTRRSSRRGGRRPVGGQRGGAGGPVVGGAVRLGGGGPADRRLDGVGGHHGPAMKVRTATAGG